MQPKENHRGREIVAEGFRVYEEEHRKVSRCRPCDASLARMYLLESGRLRESRGAAARLWHAGYLFYRPPQHGLELTVEVFPVRLVTVHIEPWRFQQFRALFSRPDLPPADLPREVLRGIPLRIFEELARGGIASEISVAALTMQLVVEFTRVVNGSLTASLYQRAMSYIEENVSSTSLTTRRLAAELDVPMKQLARTFRNERGEGVSEAIRSARVARAINLIATSCLSLKEIAGVCGFYDQSHMSNTVKRQTGRTPSSLRNFAL